MTHENAVTDDHASRTDGELAARALAGADAAFAEIVSRHKRLLHALVVRLVDDEEEAVDLVQEAFIAAHAALDRFDPQRPMRAWLARIAINKARDWQRRRRVRRLISAFLSADMVERADDAPSPEDEAQGKDELRRVKAAIARLPRNLREVLVLRTIDEMSQAETALALGLNEKSVEMRLYRARQRLKDEFDRKRV